MLSRNFSMRKIGIGFALGVALLATSACNNNASTRVACDGSSPTWNANVLDIVANSCFGSSCHGSNAQSGDYTTYAGIKSVLLNGRFEQQVLESRAMPRGETLPDSSLAKLQCWLENGFPEN
jgi:hypothetical protein